MPTPEARHHRERITRAFIAVVIVAFIALALSSCAIVKNRQAIRRISDQADRTCEAANESRAINNRDRLTLLRGARNAQTSVPTVTDPVLKKLLLDSIRNTRAEVAVRPYLEKIPGCKAPVPFPPRQLPKETP